MHKRTKHTFILVLPMYLCQLRENKTAKIIRALIAKTTSTNYFDYVFVIVYGLLVFISLVKVIDSND